MISFISVNYYPPDVIRIWIERLAHISWDKEAEDCRVKFPPPSTYTMSASVLATFLRIICRCEENKCTIVQCLEAHAIILEKIMQSSDELRHKGCDTPSGCPTFTNLLDVLCQHSCENFQSMYIVELLANHRSVAYGEILRRVNVDKYRQQCYSLAVQLGLNPVSC